VSVRKERKDAVENRQLILQTAQELFDEFGVQPVSMHQIAKTAGIGQATLYRKYAHKGDLCLDMLQEYSCNLMNEINEFLENSRHKPARERMSGILDYWIDAIEEKSELLRATEANMRCEDDRGSFFQSPMYLYSKEKMGELLSEMAEENNAPPFDADIAAHTLICSLSPVGYFHLRKEKGYSAEKIKEHYRRICLLSLQPIG